MPTKQLPERPSLDHLKAQAQTLLSAASRRDPSACQRIRESHPRFVSASDENISSAQLSWSDGLFTVAREYGFPSWARLRRRVASPEISHVTLLDRIEDPVFRQAVEAIDDGDEPGLRALLSSNPGLVDLHADFEGQNYFRSPALLAFVAENPVRNESLPPNIVDIARLLLDSGAAANKDDVEEALQLVASGRVAREAGVQCALINLFVDFGARPGSGMQAALAQGELQAANLLLELGAPMSLQAAVVLRPSADLQLLLPKADEKERHFALALAAQLGKAEALRLLLSAGEDPNRFNPPGAHSHSTPLHQAAWSGHDDAVRASLDHGARSDFKDTLWNGTALDWARHAGQTSTAALLASK